MFADLGAVIVDADAIARRIVEPGSPVLARLVEEFGDDILEADGTLRRGELARRAFASERATRHLNEITHPAIRELAEVEIAEGEGASPAGVVVYEMPLLVETGQVSLVDAVIVVDVPENVQVQRAVARGLDESDVEERMQRQASRSDRLAAADIVIDNAGELADTQRQVERAWETVLAS
jgi:dephospho-CoA kinase